MNMVFVLAGKKTKLSEILDSLGVEKTLSIHHCLNAIQNVVDSLSGYNNWGLKKEC